MLGGQYQVHEDTRAAGTHPGRPKAPLESGLLAPRPNANSCQRRTRLPDGHHHCWLRPEVGPMDKCLVDALENALPESRVAHSSSGGTGVRLPRSRAFAALATLDRREPIAAAIALPCGGGDLRCCRGRRRVFRRRGGASVGASAGGASRCVCRSHARASDPDPGVAAARCAIVVVSRWRLARRRLRCPAHAARSTQPGVSGQNKLAAYDWRTANSRRLLVAGHWPSTLLAVHSLGRPLLAASPPPTTPIPPRPTAAPNSARTDPRGHRRRGGDVRDLQRLVNETPEFLAQALRLDTELQERKDRPRGRARVSAVHPRCWSIPPQP